MDTEPVPERHATADLQEFYDASRQAVLELAADEQVPEHILGPPGLSEREMLSRRRAGGAEQCQRFDCRDRARYVAEIQIADDQQILPWRILLCGTCARRGDGLSRWSVRILGVWVPNPMPAEVLDLFYSGSPR
jgi:hypothetical protein